MGHYFFKIVSGGFKCRCGKVRNTLRSLQRHEKQQWLKQNGFTR